MHIKKIKPFIHAKYTQILPYRVRWYTCICHCRHFPEKWRRRAWFGSQYWRRTPWTCWPSSSPTTHTSTRPTTLRWGTASLGCSPSGRAPCHFTGKKRTPWFITRNKRECEKILPKGNWRESLICPFSKCFQKLHIRKDFDYIWFTCITISTYM